MTIKTILIGVLALATLAFGHQTFLKTSQLKKCKTATTELVAQQKNTIDSLQAETLFKLDSLNEIHNKELSFLNEEIQRCERKKTSIIYKAPLPDQSQEALCEEEMTKLVNNINELQLDLNLLENEFALLDFQNDSLKVENAKLLANITKHRVAKYESPLQMIEMFSEASEDSTYMEVKIFEPLYITINKTKNKLFSKKKDKYEAQVSPINGIPSKVTTEATKDGVIVKFNLNFDEKSTARNSSFPLNLEERHW